MSRGLRYHVRVQDVMKDGKAFNHQSMKTSISWLIVLALGFAFLSCGTQNKIPPRTLTVAEIADSKKEHRHSETGQRALEDYAGEIKEITRRKWDLYLTVSGEYKKSGTAKLYFMVSPEGKIEAISVSGEGDPAIARISRLSILACSYPPMPKPVVEILKEEKFVCEFNFNSVEGPKPRVKLKDGLLSYE